MCVCVWFKTLCKFGPFFPSTFEMLCGYDIRFVNNLKKKENKTYNSLLRLFRWLILVVNMHTHTYTRTYSRSNTHTLALSNWISSDRTSAWYDVSVCMAWICTKYTYIYVWWWCTHIRMCMCMWNCRRFVKCVFVLIFFASSFFTFDPHTHTIFVPSRFGFGP